MEPIHSHRGCVRPLIASAGFTLVELIVVFGIIFVITGIVFSSQSSFNKTLILTNTAYDIALSLRSVETYGLGGRVASGVINTGYGIHFTPGSKTFTLFADTDPLDGSLAGCHYVSSNAPNPYPQSGDCVYNGSDTIVTSYTLGNGITVSNLCATLSGSPSCGLSTLDIVFARPNPNPFVRANGSTGTVYTAACLTLTSPQGGFRYISVAASGAIQTNSTPCQ